MNKNFLPENDIEAVLNSFDNMQRAEANPFFYTRLKAKMESRFGERGIAGISWLKPSLAFAVLALLVVLNVFTIVNKKSNSEQEGSKNTTTLSEQVAKDYDLGNTTY